MILLTNLKTSMDTDEGLRFLCRCLCRCLSCVITVITTWNISNLSSHGVHIFIILWIFSYNFMEFFLFRLHDCMHCARQGLNYDASAAQWTLQATLVVYYFNSQICSDFSWTESTNNICSMNTNLASDAFVIVNFHFNLIPKGCIDIASKVHHIFVCYNFVQSGNERSAALLWEVERDGTSVQVFRWSSYYYYCLINTLLQIQNDTIEFRGQL